MPTSPQEEISSSTSIPFFTNLIATGFFSGYIPWASGTFGTLVGILIYLLPNVESPLILSLLIVVGFFTGVATSARVAAIVGNKLSRTAEMTKTAFQSGEHATADPSIVVIDEIVGMWISLLFLPKSIPVVIVTFVMFRAFDILKPAPARQLEHIPNGWGIMLDDVIAGVYANVATHLAILLARNYFPQLLAL
jgi:phosphatidylglycerophosphatase A